MDCRRVHHVEFARQILRFVTCLRLCLGCHGEITGSDPESDDGEFFHEYVVEANAGDELRITLRSEEFDSFLRWGTKDGDRFQELANDDDGDEDVGFILLSPERTGTSGAPLLETNAIDERQRQLEKKQMMDVLSDFLNK